MNDPLDAYRENTITSSVRLREELDVIRQKGYSLDEKEFEVGIRTVSAPIRDIAGNVVVQMSMPGPTNRLTPERISEIAQALMEVTKAVSVQGRPE